MESLSADGKRLKPREVVAEFDNYLHDELDLVREAANAAQLRRNMQGLDLVLIPEVFWDFCHAEVLVMERMKGVPINQVERLREAGVWTSQAGPRRRDHLLHPGVPRRVLPRRHAPGQHPGSLEPARFGRYISLDFGIVGTLPQLTRNTWRRTSWRSSGATTSAWPSCTSKAAGCRPTPA